MTSKNWVLGVVLITACAAPETYPADILEPTAVATVKGKALNEDGLPLAMAQLTLTKGTDSSTITTDADGLYSFTLKGSETWKPHYDGGFEHLFFIISIPGPEGIETRLQFTVKAELVQLPDLQRWKNTATPVEGTTGDLELTVPGFDAAAAQYSFGVTAVRSTQRRDAQSRTTTFVISTFDREDFDFGPTEVESLRYFDAGFVERHRQPVTLPRGTRIPVSRSAKCDGAGVATGMACPLTDGVATPVTLPRTPGLDFTFDAPQKLTRACFHSLLFLTGSPSLSVAVTGSVDGTTWVPLADPQALEPFTAPEGVTLLNSAPAVRFVRVRPVDPTDSFYSGDELSFY